MRVVGYFCLERGDVRKGGYLWKFGVAMENRIFYNFINNHAFNGGVHFLMGEVTKITRL